MWEYLVISESCARPFWQTLKSSPQRLLVHSNCHQKSGLYKCLFCLQVGIYHQRPLIKSSTINSIHCCFLLHQQWISVPATRRGVWLPLYNFWCDCYHRASSPPLSSRMFSILFPARGRPIFPHVIHTTLLPKLAQNFPFLQGWFLTSCNLLFAAHHLFCLMTSLILPFLSF